MDCPFSPSMCPPVGDGAASRGRGGGSADVALRCRVKVSRWFELLEGEGPLADEDGARTSREPSSVKWG